MTERFAILSVVTAHGINGELKCFPLADDDASLMLPLTCYTEADNTGKTVSLTAMRQAGRFRLIRLEGVRDRTEAEKWRGITLYADREAVQAPDDGTWFLADLVGMDVYEDGKTDTIGKVSSINFGPTQDLLVISADGQADILLPAVRAFLKSVDFETGKLLAQLPDGLYELYRGD